jgi:hypothetical protein
LGTRVSQLLRILGHRATTAAGAELGSVLGERAPASGLERRLPGLAQEAVHGSQQLVRLDRLLKEGCAGVRRASMEEVVGRIGGDVEHGEQRKAVAQPEPQRSAVELRHDHVGNDQMEVGIGKGGHAQRLFPVAGLEGSVARIAKHAGQRSPNHIFVFRDEDDTRIGSGLGLLQNGLETRGI